MDVIALEFVPKLVLPLLRIRYAGDVVRRGAGAARMAIVW